MNRLKQILALTGVGTLLFFAGCAGDESKGKRSTGEIIDDTALHTKVKAALLNDPIVHATSIDVHVDHGVVSLNGAVNGDVEKKKAEDIARGVDGVRGVENNIIVRHY